MRVLGLESLMALEDGGALINDEGSILGDKLGNKY